ncbi:MAG: glycosyltransferase family 2 protein [Ferruginibacter sp.]|nr:glycosyltransferase family 2 protein [Ferruginibacter sp.]
MKISGVTIIRNAIINDYPIVEAIQSILPVVDEMIVSVGDSEDETETLIRNIGSDKIKIFHSHWDLSVRKGGSILAIETNKALQHVSPDTDWIFYIQGDEVVHEKYHDNIRWALRQYHQDNQVEGLLFNYLHFYGTYDYVADSRKWYKYETRIIRNNRNILSYRDAQGFRKHANRKINVALINAYVYHYGWVKNPRQMKIKQKNMAELWFEDDNLVNKIKAEEDYFDYGSFDSLKKFTETHPAVMRDRINQKNWHIELDISRKKMKLKYRILQWIENLTGKRLFTFTNHIIIRK